MGIWDSLRRFSNRGTSSRESSTKRRGGAGKKRIQARGLRLEQFEARMLLSITTPGLDDTSDVEPIFGNATITPPAAGQMSLVVLADSPDDYRVTIPFNVDAADSTNVEHVTSGGSLGLDLTGEGYTVGVWDAGSVLSTHQEFDGRVTVIDGAASHSHSTHVGGTIGASGVGFSGRRYGNGGGDPVLRLGQRLCGDGCRCGFDRHFEPLLRSRLRMDVDNRPLFADLALRCLVRRYVGQHCGGCQVSVLTRTTRPPWTRFSTTTPNC